MPFKYKLETGFAVLLVDPADGLLFDDLAVQRAAQDDHLPYDGTVIGIDHRTANARPSAGKFRVNDGAFHL
jgi:hypothetical protein